MIKTLLGLGLMAVLAIPLVGCDDDNTTPIPVGAQVGLNGTPAEVVSTEVKPLTPQEEAAALAVTASLLF
jgi:protein-disulfide isomerase